MAVEAVVSVVIQKVTDLLIQESIIFDKVINQVEDIRLELRRMRGFLMDAEERRKMDENAKEWAGKYLEILYNVEDVVETYVLRLARKKREMGFFQNYGLFFHDLSACRNLRREMKQIEVEIKGLHDRKPSHLEDASLRCSSLSPEEAQLELDEIDFGQDHDSFANMSSNITTGNFSRETKRMLSNCYEEEDSDFVGFKEYASELSKRLTEECSSNIVPVVGALGSGKTTLVRRIYNRKSTKSRFDCCAWLDVSEEYALKDLLLRIWNQVNKKKSDNSELTVLDEGQLKDKLLEALKKLKYLIVLDGAREKPDAWKQMIHALPSMENGSKLVLITHEEAIAQSLGGGSNYSNFLCLKQLGDEESWELFLRKLWPEGSKNYGLFSPHPALKQEILNKCQGLPLNIVLLGGLLSTKKMSYGEWTRLFRQANWRSSDIWLLSYNDLPPHYKLCLLYLGLFPKEFDVSVRRILRLWLAEGFLRPSPGQSEESADECFNNLVSRNLIKITKFRSDGGPRKCRLPGFLREHLSPRAQEISLFHIHHKSAELSDLPAYGVRRIVEYADIKEYARGSNSNSTQIKNLRSYLSFHFPRYDTPAKQVGDFLCKIIGSKGFGLLRVLDLEGVYKPMLPPTLKHLVQLRYLGLRWTFLDTLPESVGDLPYLETLDLKRTYINHLPSSIWKRAHLRHLNLPEIRLDMPLQQPTSQLLTLWGLIIDDDRNMENGLGLLVDLRELGVTCQLKQFDKLMSWITSLTRLQSLSLTSKDGMGRPSNINLDPLSELGELSHLEVLGQLSQRLTKDQFPRNLKVLTLSVSQLREDPLPTLSQLSCLVVLRLLAKSYLGQKMHCPKDGFGNLRILKLWMLEELEEWTVQERGMSQIRELNIRRCHKLKELPSELSRRSTLEEVILDDMPKEFEEITKKSKASHTILTIRPYVFTDLPWEKDADLWKETAQV